MFISILPEEQLKVIPNMFSRIGFRCIKAQALNFTLYSFLYENIDMGRFEDENDHFLVK
jgi:hypothetical protein